MAVILIIWISGIIVAGILASQKNRSVARWVWGSILLSPLLIIILLFLSSLGGRKCKFCAEMIKEDATVCRFCGREVTL